MFVDLGIRHAMHVPHYHLWPVWLYNIFPHYLIQGKVFKQKNIEHKTCVLIFSTTFICNIFCSKNWVRYDQKCILVFMSRKCYSCQILMKLEFSPQIFEKYSSIKLYENPSNGSWGVPCGRTDRHDKANSHVLQFCEHA